MKKITALVLAVLMMALAFTACGSPAPAPAASTAPAASSAASAAPAASSAPAPAETKELITITMPTYRSGEDVGAKYFLPAVERFNAKFDGQYKVVIEESPSSTHNDKIKALAQNGKLPPIFQFSDIVYLRENWLNDNFLYDISGWLDSNPDIKGALIPAGLDYVTMDNGAIYGMPLAIVRPTGSYVNNNVFTPSKPLRDMTWDELGAELKAAGTTYGFMTLEGAWTVNLTVVAIMSAQENGVKILEDGLTEHVKDFNTPQWINTFTILKKLYDDAGWASGVGKAYPDTENGFVNNQIGVLPNGQWIISVFDPESSANWGEGFDGAKVTGDIFPGNVAITNPRIYDYFISNQCSEDERECALAFLGFLTSQDEIEAMILAEGGSAPMLDYSASFLTEVAKNKLMSDFSSAVNENTIYVPYFHEIVSNTITDAAGAFTANLPLLFDGTLTPEQFCNALTVAANE